MRNFLANLCLMLCCFTALEGAKPPSGIWTPPVILSVEPAQNVQGAVDGDGNAVVVWNVGLNLYASTCPAAGEWSPSQRLALKTLPANVAMDSTGNALTVWPVQEASSFSIQAATLPAGATEWTLMGEIARSEGDTQGAPPAIVFDGAGNATVGWVTHFEGKDKYQSLRLAAGSTSWTPIDDLIPKLWIFWPSLAVSENGIVVVTFVDETIWNVKAARLANGATTWSDIASLSDCNTPAGPPKVVLDNQGNAFVEWLPGLLHVPGAGAAYLAANSNDWLPVPLPKGCINITSHALAVEAEGDVIALWATHNDNDKKFWIKTATFKAATQSWSKLAILDKTHWKKNGPQTALCPVQLQTDAVGNAVASWMYEGDPQAEFSLATRNVGGKWSTSVRLSDAAQGSTLLDNRGDITQLYIKQNVVNVLQGTGFFKQAN